MQKDVYGAEPDVVEAAPLPPLAKGQFLLGHALPLYRRPLQHMRQLYEIYGPIYRVRVPGREFTVLGGIEANKMLANTGDEFFVSGELFADFAQEMQTDKFLIAMDGAEHRVFRKQLRPAHSKYVLASRLQDVVAITERHVGGWPVGGRITVMDAMQRIITEQIGTVLIGYPPGDYFEDVRIFMNTILRSLVTKTWPRWMIYRPAYRRAKARLFRLAQDLVARYKAMPESERPSRALVTELLPYLDETGPQRLTEENIISSVVGTYLAGLDTVAGSLSFMLYAFLKHGVWERLVAEAESLLAEEPLTMDKLRGAKVLHAAVMEAMRMYPVAAFTPRVAARSFVFQGYRVEKGTHVLIANGLTHYLPEFFPNPDRFEIERHLEPRKEYTQAAAFAPFSLGPHTCLGAGLGEVQMMVTLATILTRVELALDPPDYVVGQALTPTPSPGFGFKLRVVRFR
ncbi:MAG: cytochrome P450 [Chloroflexi bacterium]|nr:MAG: cytochrome P450 [Chloroflexota bacterium]